MYSGGFQTNFIREANNLNPEQSDLIWVNTVCNNGHQSTSQQKREQTAIVVKSVENREY